MPNSYFQFKQFTIHQDRCAMKVGTDGVLLGAWVECLHANRILDIGTGTGLIALMLAQRNPIAAIDALEIEEAASAQAKENVAASPWGERIEIIHAPLLDFQYSPAGYDLIVSNPPFFTESLQAATRERTLARHNAGLLPEELISRAGRMLTKQGVLALVYPGDMGCRVQQIARENKLYLKRECAILPTPNKQAKRVLLEFSKAEHEPQLEQLVLEKYGRHKYSEEFIALCRDFYLKL